MKALTICQPYPYLILTGHKPIENRTWFTNYRGELLIHAGLSKEWLDGFDVAEFDQGLMKFGYVVGIATLADCLPKTSNAPRFEQLQKWGQRSPLWFHEHANGPWCWVLENIHRLSEPLQVSGKQGLWDPPAWLVSRVRSMKLERVA